MDGARTEEHVDTPPLPSGDRLTLPGRGTTFVRTLPGPPGAPTVLLLHGWIATADVNWFRQYFPLGDHFRVVALDHRGHGRGIRSTHRFRLADCADDAIAVCDVLGIERVIPVGYSMGGPIAQLVWRRHPTRTRGLVLAATAASFAQTHSEHLGFLGLGGLAALARVTPRAARERLSEHFYLRRKSEQWGPWAIEEASHNNWRTVLEAGQAIGSYHADEWIRAVDVPSSVIVTTRDEVVAPWRQEQLAAALPDAFVQHVAGGHDSVVNPSIDFTTTLLAALSSVVRRSRP